MALRLLHTTFCKRSGRSDRQLLCEDNSLVIGRAPPVTAPMSHSLQARRRMRDIYRVSHLPHFQNTPDPQVFSLSWQGVSGEFLVLPCLFAYHVHTSNMRSQIRFRLSL